MGDVRAKILFVTEYYPFYAARLVHEIAKRLVAEGCEVTVLTSNFHIGEKTKISCREESIDGVDIIRFDAFSVSVSSTPKIIFNPIRLMAVRKMLKRMIVDTDILHLHTGHGLLNLLVAVLANIYRNDNRRLMVYTSHGIPGGYDSFLLNFGSVVAKKVVRHLIIENCRLVTAVGLQDVAYWAKHGVPRRKIFFVPNGVDTKAFRRSNVLRSRYREKLGFNIDDFVVLFLAQFREAKGLVALLDAMPRVLMYNSNIKFLLVGSGPLTHDVDMFIRKFNLETKVKLLSHYVPDEDLPGIYNASDIYVLPSFIEGMPLSLMEAMACGNPVVATNVGDVPLLVKNGLNGFLIPPGDSEAIVQKIIHLFNQRRLRNTMEANNTKKMFEYDWDKIAKKYLELYLRSK